MVRSGLLGDIKSFCNSFHRNAQSTHHDNDLFQAEGWTDTGSIEFCQACFLSRFFGNTFDLSGTQIFDGFVKSASAALRFIPTLLNSRYARRGADLTG